MNSTKCRICGCEEVATVCNSTRDIKDINVLKCLSCGTVFLDSFKHINDKFYEESGMRSPNTQESFSTSYKSLAEWRRSSYDDDLRRFSKLESLIKNADILDFGAGAAGFLAMSKNIAKSAVGVELDTAVNAWCKNKGIDCYQHISKIPHEKKFDIITAFHVIEHLKDPVSFLKLISKYLKPGGRIFLEFPNANDALVSLYDSKEFAKFTYWSCHLMLFTNKSIKKIIETAGLNCVNISQVQRYPLSNHMFWLAKGKPGGHDAWKFLNCDVINLEYEKKLAEKEACDTIFVEISRSIKIEKDLC